MTWIGFALTALAFAACGINVWHMERVIRDQRARLSEMRQRHERERADFLAWREQVRAFLRRQP